VFEDWSNNLLSQKPNKREIKIKIDNIKSSPGFCYRFPSNIVFRYLMIIAC
jgi:hypothetical protein